MTAMVTAMVTRSRTQARAHPRRTQAHAHPRLAPNAEQQSWRCLPAELLGRIALMCDGSASMCALDAVDQLLWATRVERLLSALQEAPSEPLLLHVRHVAHRAAPELVDAGAVPALIASIAHGEALPTGGLQRAFGTVTALLDAAKAADATSMLEATVAAELLQKGLLRALKVRRVRLEPSTSRPAHPATHAPEPDCGAVRGAQGVGARAFRWAAQRRRSHR